MLASTVRALTPSLLGRVPGWAYVLIVLDGLRVWALGCLERPPVLPEL